MSKVILKTEPQCFSLGVSQICHTKDKKSALVFTSQEEARKMFHNFGLRNPEDTGYEYCLPEVKKS